MAEKKATKKTKTKDAKAKKEAKPVKESKAKTKSSSKKSTKSKKTSKAEPIDDMGIVIVEDDLSIDKEKVNEERKAYLEEARSQEAFD